MILEPRKFFAMLIATLLIAAAAVTPAYAWDHCGTPQAEPDCPAVPSPMPSLTPVSATPALPTAQPVQPDTASAAAGAPNSLSEYCHYEPHSGRWEIRRTTNSSPQLLGPLPIAPHVCAQPTSLPAPTATPVAAATAITVPPLPPALHIIAEPPPTIESIAPEQPGVEAPPADDEQPAPQMPQGLPQTGGDGCDYYGTCLED